MFKLAVLTAAGLILNCAFIYNKPALAIVSGAVFALGIYIV